MPFQPERKIPPAELERFTFRKPFDGPSEVTATLLADLYDCAFTFGVESYDRQTRTISMGEPLEIAIQVSTDPIVTTIIVMGPDGLATEGMHVGQMRSNGLLWWDKRVRVEDVVACIQQTDKFFRRRGWVDPIVGRGRRGGLIATERRKRSVERTFQVRGIVFPVLPPYQSGEELRSEFDNPELVAILPAPFGGEALCHIRDREAVEIRQRLSLEALAKLGYNDLSKLPTDVEEVLALRTRVEELVKEMTE